MCARGIGWSQRVSGAAKTLAIVRTDRLICARPTTGPGSDPHAPKPRAGIDFDALVTRTQKDVYELIRDHPAAKKTKDGGYINNNAPGYSVIARELRISHRTVARCVKALIAKGYLQAFEILARDGHRTGTRYVLPFWGKVWADWRKDKRIAHTDDGFPIVYGRGKRWMTPEEAATWSIRRYSGIQPQAMSAAEPEEIAPEADTPDTPALARPPDADLEVIRVELTRWSGEAAMDDAWFLLSKARETDPETPPAAVVDTIRVAATVRRKVDARYAFTPGWFLAKMDGAARDWREKARKQQRQAEKHTRWDREHRVNALASFIRQIANPHPETPLVDLDWFREQIAAADPEERAQAEALLADTQTRAAGG